MSYSLFLNPHVWENCTNVYREYWYCVRPVGYISTYPGYTSTTPTTEFVQTPSTPLPVVDNPMPGLNETKPPIIPVANGTRIDCALYVPTVAWFKTQSMFNAYTRRHQLLLLAQYDGDTFAC
jgi:hypothetical protein